MEIVFRPRLWAKVNTNWFPSIKHLEQTCCVQPLRTSEHLATFQIRITMSTLSARNLRPIINLCAGRFASLSLTQRRWTVTVTDEYRPTTKSRSSLKGVELLRNPSLNKVSACCFADRPFLQLSFRVWPSLWKNANTWAFTAYFHLPFYLKIFKRCEWWLIFIEFMVDGVKLHRGGWGVNCSLLSSSDDLDRYSELMNLSDRNEKLFYRVIAGLISIEFVSLDWGLTSFCR